MSHSVEENQFTKIRVNRDEDSILSCRKFQECLISRVWIDLNRFKDIVPFGA